MNKILEIWSADILNNVMHNPKYDVVVVYIYGKWCGPCKMVGPKYAALAQEMGGDNVLFCKLDVDLKLRNDVTGVPTFEIWKKDPTGKKSLSKKVMGADIAQLRAALDGLSTQQQPQARYEDYARPKPSQAHSAYATYGSLT